MSGRLESGKWLLALCVPAILLLLGSGRGLDANDQSAAAPTGTARVPFAVVLAAQGEPASESEQNVAGEHSETEPEEHGTWEQIFHWFNFLLIVGGIWWMVRKLLVPFLEERGRLIRMDMDHSAKALSEADQRLAAVEAKLRQMDAEMAEMRRAALQEASSERARIEEAAKAESRKALSIAEMEIEAAVKAARQELKRYAAQLAVGVAEHKIRASLTPQTEHRILRSFVQELASLKTASGDGVSAVDSRTDGGSPTRN